MSQNAWVTVETVQPTLSTYIEVSRHKGWDEIEADDKPQVVSFKRGDRVRYVSKSSGLERRYNVVWAGIDRYGNNKVGLKYRPSMNTFFVPASECKAV